LEKEKDARGKRLRDAIQQHPQERGVQKVKICIQLHFCLYFLSSFPNSNYFRNQEQFVRRLINAQSHFGTQQMDERLESREKLIQLKTHAKRF
jgi:hypothetical protein